MGIGTTYLGERLMVILAAILGLGSNLGNAFAPQPSLLFFTQSTLYALTSESAHLSAMLILGKYFEKRRGMAYAVANFGAGIGGLVLPQLVTYLFNEYGLRGTLIIIGGLHLHFCPI
ncbi:monocarboxylate transporter 12-like, partial [Saccostrea cucullata]|uniref:monocarboxylate transporter 12-like n=1 Tax=Saccostrea cuccullata TaxID=36930 RepID=UPI002ED02289